MAKQWKDLTEKQKKKFGGNKKAFKQAKKQVKKSGGDASSVLQIKKAHKGKAPAPKAPAPKAAPKPAAKSAPATFAPANYEQQIQHLMKHQKISRDQAVKQNQGAINQGMDLDGNGYATDAEYLRWKKGERAPKPAPKPSFKEAVKDLGADGKINNNDYQKLVQTYGEKKVENKLEQVSKKNDIKIGNRPSKALNIKVQPATPKKKEAQPRPTKTESKPSFKEAVKDLGADGKINNKDYKKLVQTYGEKKVENKLEQVSNKNDIKIGNRPSEALGVTKPKDADKPAKKDEPKPSFKKAVKELGEDGKINKKDFKKLVEEYGEKKVTNKLEEVADKNDIKVGNTPSKVLAISKPADKKLSDKKSTKKPVVVSKNVDVNALRASVGLPPLSAEQAQKVKDKAAQDNAYAKHIGSIGAKEFNKRVKDAGGFDNYRKLFDKGEHETKKPSFKEAVKDLGADGKINNKEYKELVDTYGEKKVANKLEKVSDKNDIKIGNKPSEALGINKQPAKAEPTKTEPVKTEPVKTDDKPSFKEAVKDLGADGKINNKDYKELVDTYGEKKVTNKLEKVADKNDIKIGNKPSESLGIKDQQVKTEPVKTEPVTTEDKPSFKEAVKELGADGKINNKDYQQLVDEYGDKKVTNKLEKVADKNDINIGNRPSEALGIKKPEDISSPSDSSPSDSRPSFKNAVKELGADGKISNADYQNLLDEYGEKKVGNKLETIADKNDIKIGNRPSEALGIEEELDIYKDKDLNINEPIQPGSPPKVTKTTPKAFQDKIDQYYEKGLKRYEGRMQTFAEDFNKGLERYKGKEDESGRNKIQREYKDKRTADAKAYDRDKSQFQKDKLNSLYAQRRDLLDDKGMVKRPSLDASTTPNPYEGAISQIKQALGIKKPNANYLKDQVKNSLTMKIDKPALSLNIAGAESARKFTAKKFTKPDYSYKPRT